MSDVKKLLKKHGQLNQLDNVKVESHVQRDKDDWVLNFATLYRRLTPTPMICFSNSGLI